MSTSLPPVDINKRTVKTNLFSRHDNRHTLQNCGEYFGQGMGKKRLRVENDQALTRNQHCSDNHTSWGSKLINSSTYRHGYGSDPSRLIHRRSLSASSTPLNYCEYSTLRADKSLLDKFHTLTKPNFRRFPHRHSLPANLSGAKSEDLISTVLWNTTPVNSTHKVESMGSTSGSKNGGKMYSTPLSVLAATQQPFLDHSPWKYSYKQ